MANTTFNGPVRSENGFKTIIKNSTTGALTNEMTLSTYTATITVATTGTSCLLYTSPSPRDATLSRMPSSA